MRFYLLAAVLLVLAGSASAWGPVASKRVCTEAVRLVWGEDAVSQCLPVADNATLEEFCDSTYAVLGQDYEGKCKAQLESGAGIDPSTVSAVVFNDPQNHLDFSKCPMTEGTARAWICGSGERPAYDIARKWFQQAESASSLCARVYDFCAGASYFADSESSLHQVMFADPKCLKDIEDSIDRSIEAGTTDWSASQLCNFNNKVKGKDNMDAILNSIGNLNYKARMGESANTLNRVIANLTAKGYELKAMPYTPKKGVVVLANSADMPAATELAAYLRAGGVNAILSTSSDFERLRYNARLVIVGGQNSPEGVGAAAASVLSIEEESFLLSAGAGNIFEKDGPWAAAQRVVVAAGNEAADTARVLSKEREKILEAVK